MMGDWTLAITNRHVNALLRDRLRVTVMVPYVGIRVPLAANSSYSHLFVGWWVYFAAGIHAYVGPSIHEKGRQRRLVGDKNAAGAHAVVVCRFYGRRAPFPCIHLHGDWHLYARSPNVRW